MSVERFRKAQDRVWDTEVEPQLQAGRKTSHWIWFVFPGPPHPQATSPMNRRYALQPDEVDAYWDDPVLRDRLIWATSQVRGHVVKGRSLEHILGSPVDVLKFRSCMRLFAHRLKESYEDQERSTNVDT